MNLETERDFLELILGAKILGCGGGGEESLALSRVKYILEHNLEVKVIDPKDLPNDALICICGMVGGRRTPECLANVGDLPATVSWPMFAATQLLANHLGEEFNSLVSTEIGAGNFLVPILVSARLGITVIDGDLCGRAKPEISISTTNVQKIPITPLAIASSYGDEVILKTSLTDQRAEQIAREIAVLSGGAVGVARCPARWEDYSRAVIPNTMSKAQEIGAKVLSSRERGRNPVKEIVDILSGKILFKGKVESFIADDLSGFVVGTVNLVNDQSEKFKIWFKNEFLIAWINDRPLITSPDLICVVDAQTGEGLTPWDEDFTRDREVIVFGAKNAPLWYSKRGLAIFGPRHFGFDFDYQTIFE